jgi:hypothetical protein
MSQISKVLNIISDFRDHRQDFGSLESLCEIVVGEVPFLLEIDEGAR